MINLSEPFWRFVRENVQKECNQVYRTMFLITLGKVIRNEWIYSELCVYKVKTYS